MPDPDAITGLEGTRFHTIQWVEETASTNTDVLAAARDGAGEGLVIVADHQVAGRGRAGRTWTAPPGASLLCTILLRPPAPVAGLVTFALGVAAVDAVAEVAGVEAGVKWPNDLLAGGKKLAGILAEAEWPAGSHIAAGWKEPAAYERATVAAGIGLNVRWPDDLPDDLADIATALNHLSSIEVDRADVLSAMLRRLDVLYGQMVAGDTEAVLDAWRERSLTLGSAVRVDLGADDVEGTAVDITNEGHLVVDDLDGTRRVLAVGDVVHLRPR